ncbi:MAG TPA: MgtC/SapB family protein [Streptosporangiaceae bacterium]|nr:MgtC/SapB family protein [Streptosporangiaceae bacterium]
MAVGLGISGGEGWVQIGELGLAFGLSAVIGLEREIRQKSAGLRTHALVGVAAALIVLVSKYGFSDVLVKNQIVLDPSRVAAQIVSGIGFLGAGLIFVRRDAVRGLTTAATVWLTAGVGMACGAGLPLLALTVSGMYFIVMLALTPLSRRLPLARNAPSTVRVTYEDGRGVLRRVLQACTNRGFQVAEMNVEEELEPERTSVGSATLLPERDANLRRGRVTVLLTVYRGRSLPELVTELTEIDGVESVNAGDVNATAE